MDSTIPAEEDSRLPIVLIVITKTNIPSNDWLDSNICVSNNNMLLFFVYLYVLYSAILDIFVVVQPLRD